MRLREVKKQLESLLDGEQIQIEVEQRYNGYAQTIVRSRELFTVLRFLSQQSWNNTDFTQVEAVITKYNALVSKEITVDQGEFNEVNAYVNAMNQKLPIFLGIVNNLVDEQSPQDINIKLSESIDTPQKLEKLIKDITELEKYSNIEGSGLKFSGFDKGSEWIVITALAPVTYAFIMSCLKLAQEYLKTKEQFFKTEEARIAYTASLLEKNEKFTDNGFEKYLSNYSKAQLKKGTEDIANALGEVNGHGVSEIKQKAEKTTGSLINIIGDGNQVHLTLNPPKQLSENVAGEIEVDYSYLTDLNKKPEPKELNAGKPKKAESDDEGRE